MNQNKKIIAIIPAAGVGSRMQSQLPKQYLPLLGKTVLEYSLELFLNQPQISQVIVAVSNTDPYFQTLTCFSHPKIRWVTGGTTRAESVLNALQVIIDEEVWVLVHDAARPCLTWQEVTRLIECQAPCGAILATPIVETVKQTKFEKRFYAAKFDKSFPISKTLDRRNLWLAQTPQFFPANLLKQTLTQALAAGVTITDEASALEWAGRSVALVQGLKTNLKITYPEDLALAEFYLSHFTPLILK